MQPQTAQKQKVQLISLDRVTEPVVGKENQEKEWRMLHLGTPATPPVCRQEFELGNTVAVPSQHRDGLVVENSNEMLWT